MVSVLATIACGFRLTTSRARSAKPSGRPSPAQLVENPLIKSTSPTSADTRDWTRGDDDRNPVLLRRLLRPHFWRCGSEQQTDGELAPPHSITLSASASSDGGMARFSKRAVFRLM